MVPTLMAETEKFFDAVAMVKKGTFQDLFLSPVAFVNAATAPLYGLSASGFTTDFKETMLDATQRPGFLTRVGFLNAYAFYNRTSPIHRGAFIMKQVLGTPIGTPPPGAEATDAAARVGGSQHQPQAGRRADRGRRLRVVPPRLHQPGRLRDGGVQRRRHLADDGEVDRRGHRHHRGRGHRRQSPNTSPAPLELMMAIAASPMAQHRYAERLTSYMLEREGEPLDCGAVNDLATKIAPGGYTLLEPDHGPHTNSSVPNPSRRGDVMNRRVFLRGVGGASLAAPFLPSIYEKAAKAQGTTPAAPPKRLVIYFTHNGCLTNRWFPKVTTYTNGAAPLTAAALTGGDAGAADAVHQQAACSRAASGR